MKKQFIASLCVLAMVGMAVGVGAQGADTVECSVTPMEISVSVSPTLTDYGIMGINNDNIAVEIFTVTNTGNEVEDITITGSDTTDWGLAGSPGNETFTHKFFLGDTWNDTGSIALSTISGTFVDDLASTNTQKFRLKIYTPTATVATGVQSTSITLTATYGG